MKLYLTVLEDYWGYIPLSIILQSCIGSVTCMYLLQDYKGDNFIGSFIELTMCTSICMIYNAAILAQMKVKLVFNLLLISLLTNITLIIIINLIKFTS